MVERRIFCPQLSFSLQTPLAEGSPFAGLEFAELLLIVVVAGIFLFVQYRGASPRQIAKPSSFYIQA
jgi:hypothetical protein